MGKWGALRGHLEDFQKKLVFSYWSHTQILIFIFIIPRFTLRNVTLFKDALYLWQVQIQIWLDSEYFANSPPLNPSRISHQTVFQRWGHLLKSIKANTHNPRETHTGRDTQNSIYIMEWCQFWSNCTVYIAQIPQFWFMRFSCVHWIGWFLKSGVGIVGGHSQS